MSDPIEPSFPDAAVRLVRRPQGYLWIIDVCPLCGQRHTHGGGALDGDPYQLLSHRNAHCASRPIPEPGGYLLVAMPAHEVP
jgi:hypothetical protein